MTHCRFGAISLPGKAGATVDPLSCEGCGVCRMVCPVGAVTMRPNRAGAWMVRETTTGPLVHARLGIAQDNSGKLVARVREVARDEARNRASELVLIDGPPGIGCPVHAAVTGADLLLAVTEPTPSGLHDLERVLQLAQMFQLQAKVLINKADLSERYVERVHGLTRKAQVQLVGCLPFDPRVPKLLAQGTVPLSLPAWAEGLRAVWLRIHAHLLEARRPEEARDAFL